MATTTERRGLALLEPLVVAALVGAATLLVALRDPHVPGSYGVCPSLMIFGLACPGCGGLRATHDLAHLDLVGAWASNPLVVVLLPAVVGLWSLWLAARWSPRRTMPTVPRVVWITVGAIAVIFGVVRNIPGAGDFLGPA
ncbi:DUF2752 domain-containing protein [Paraoerskovia marina]|uniref:DUF2752 domain-containing protein n=1 Tax=Paraoerskovia marina TaxID=545619 RepID=UPI0004925EB4|nr:DUF2752 domain-containing protein [Paraoerskovia marina]